MLNALLGRTEKADYATPGFKWKPMKNKQGIKGTMYTAFPLSVATRFWPSVGIGFILGALLTAGSLSGICATILLAYAVFLSINIWPFTRTIKITPDYLAISGKRYDVNEITQIRTMQKSFGRNFPSYMIQFEYGRKTIKIKNTHKEKDAFRIAEALHQFVNEAKGIQAVNQQEQETAAQYETPEQSRAAAF